MKLARLTSLTLLTALTAACGDGREDVSPTSGSVTGVSVGQGTGGAGGDGGAGGNATVTTGGEGGTGGTGQTTTTTTTTGTGGAGGQGGAGGEGGAGGQGGTGGSGGAGGQGGDGGAGGSPPDPCANGMLDLGETDVDCGGLTCAPCSAGQACVGPTDCDDLVCTDLICVAGTCSDGVANGGESDVDCGGLTCSPCEVDEQCGVGSDCITGVCDAAGECAAATCNDSVLNGEETDIDCGGGCPVPCGSFDSCLVPEDCESGVCTGEECQPPSCSDGVFNGNETDVDCGGGGACPDCGAGKACEVESDCLSNDCFPGNGQPGGVCFCPAGMTTVPIPGGGSYCIDPTEVTYAEYDAFITANPPYANPVCAFNVGGYTPSLLWPPSAATADPNYIQRPVRYVDWCDAAAYCSWRGKRLCGSIDGGPAALDALNQPGEDQWFNACTASGTNTYPYSGAFTDGACTESVGTPVTVPSAVRNAQFQVLTTCQGGFSDIHQMSGNVAEWVDACDGSAGAADGCIVRGGSYATAVEADLTCSATDSVARNTRSAEIGIRCCQ